MAYKRSVTMPTLAKLVGLIGFGALGWYLAQTALPLYGDSPVPSQLALVAAAIAAVLGWVHIGQRAGHGYASAIAQGVTWVFIFGACLVTYLGSFTMLAKAQRGAYADLAAAAIDLLDLIWREVLRFGDVTLLATAVAGAVIAAIVTEFVAQRYP